MVMEGWHEQARLGGIVANILEGMAGYVSKAISHPG